MLDILGGVVSLAGYQRIIVDIALWFGLLLIVSMALNFQYGNAGVPNMGCAVQVIIGGLTASSITTRLVFFIMQQGEIKLLPYSSDYDWVYNNQVNVNILANGYLKNNPLLTFSLFLFSLGVAVVLGSLMGWFIALPAIRLKATYLMITLITMADASQLFAKNIPSLCGGTLGMYVPDVFVWYPGDRGVITTVTTLLIGLVSFFIFNTMLNSPYGRLMRSLRENETTLGSIGKNVVGIRRNILMFASGITALAGVLVAFYYSYVIDSNYYRGFWTYWPWLMLMLGGPGNNAGTFLGCAVIVVMRRLIVINKFLLEGLFFFPVSYLEDTLLGALLIISMLFRPSGLIPEKLLYIGGVNYGELVKEEKKVDWRETKKPRSKDKKGLLNFSFKKSKNSS